MDKKGESFRRDSGDGGSTLEKTSGVNRRTSRNHGRNNESSTGSSPERSCSSPGEADPSIAVGARGRERQCAVSRSRRGSDNAPPVINAPDSLRRQPAQRAASAMRHQLRQAPLDMEKIASAAARAYKSSQEASHKHKATERPLAEALDSPLKPALAASALRGHMEAQGAEESRAPHALPPGLDGSSSALAAHAAAAVYASSGGDSASQLQAFLALLRTLSATPYGAAANPPPPAAPKMEVERAKHLLEACAGNIDMAAALYWDDASHLYHPPLLADNPQKQFAAAAANNKGVSQPLLQGEHSESLRQELDSGADRNKGPEEMLDDASAIAAAAKGAAAAEISNRETDYDPTCRKRPAPELGAREEVGNLPDQNRRRRSCRNHLGAGLSVQGASHLRPRLNNDPQGAAEPMDAGFEAAEQVIQGIEAANRNNEVDPLAAALHHDELQSVNVSDDEQAVAALLVESMAPENIAADEAAVARHCLRKQLSERVRGSLSRYNAKRSRDNRLNELARHIWKENKASSHLRGDDCSTSSNSSTNNELFNKEGNVDELVAQNSDEKSNSLYQKRKRDKKIRGGIIKPSNSTETGDSNCDEIESLFDIAEEDGTEQDTSYLLWGITKKPLLSNKERQDDTPPETIDCSHIPPHWKLAGFSLSPCKTGPVAPMTFTDESADEQRNRQQRRQKKPMTHYCGGVTAILSIIAALLQSGASVQGKKVQCEKIRSLGKRFFDISDPREAGRDYEDRLADAITSLLWIAASSYHMSRHKLLSQVGSLPHSKGVHIAQSSRRLCRVCTWQHDPIDTNTTSNNGHRVNERICEAVWTSLTNMCDLRAYVVSSMPLFIGPGGCALLLETIIRMHGVKRVHRMVDQAGGKLPLVRCLHENDQSSSSGPGCMSMKHKLLTSQNRQSPTSRTRVQDPVVFGTTNCMSVELLSLLLTGQVHTDFNSWSAYDLGIGLLSSEESLLSEDVHVSSTCTDHTIREPNQSESIAIKAGEAESNLILTKKFNTKKACFVGKNLKNPQCPVWLIKGDMQYTAMWLEKEEDKKIMDTPGSAFQIVQWFTANEGEKISSRVLTARKSNSFEPHQKDMSARNFHNLIHLENNMITGIKSHHEDRLYYPNNYKRWRFTFDYRQNWNDNLKNLEKEEKKDDDHNGNLSWTPYFRLSANQRALVDYVQAPKFNIVIWSRWPSSQVTTLSKYGGVIHKLPL